MKKVNKQLFCVILPRKKFFHRGVKNPSVLLSNALDPGFLFSKDY